MEPLGKNYFFFKQLPFLGGNWSFCWDTAWSSTAPRWTTCIMSACTRTQPYTRDTGSMKDNHLDRHRVVGVGFAARRGVKARGLKSDAEDFAFPWYDMRTTAPPPGRNTLMFSLSNTPRCWSSYNPLLQKCVLVFRCDYSLCEWTVD